MTLNDVTCTAFTHDTEVCTVTLVADSFEDAVAAIAGDMVIRDGVGNQVDRLTGFTHINKVEVDGTLSTFIFTLQRTTTLNSEVQTLRSQLRAAEETNAFLEECIVEMAGIIYA